MDFAQIVDIALPVVYVLVGAVLVWFVVELALTIRSTRSTIDDVHEELTPPCKTWRRSPPRSPRSWAM